MLKSIQRLIRFALDSFLFKMIVSYSVIIILMLAVLTLVISSNYSNDLKLDEINYENQIIRRVADRTDANISTAKKILQQIYLSNSSAKRDFFAILEDTEKDVDITLDYYSQRNTFKSICQSEVSGESDLIDIIVYKVQTKDILYFADSPRKIDRDFNFSSYKLFEAAKENYGVFRILPSYIPEYITNDKRPVYSAYAGLMDSHDNLAGIIIFNFDAQKLERSYAEYKKSVKGNILVIDKEGKVFYDSSNQYYDKTYPYFKQLKNSSNYLQLKDESLVVLRDTQNYLVAAGIVPKKDILRRINMVVRTIFLVMTLCIFISIILVYIISTRFSRRVKSVTNAMKEVEKGNLQKRIPQGRGNDDVEQINRNFNRMCERLESYIQKVYLAEIKAKDAQLTALQTQINPHFLYNTLEAIRMKAIISNAEEVSEMIYILGNLFRDSLENSDMVIRVEEEVNYCKAYLELHRIRLCDRLKVVFDIDETIMDCAILKLLLQPLIENSLVYVGIYDNTDSLTINVKGYCENGTIKISVIDNGVGIEPEDLDILLKDLKGNKTVKKRGSIGLRNINDRIKIIFGDGYDLEISSVKNAYTKVTVNLPALTIEEVRKRVQDTNC